MCMYETNKMLLIKKVWFNLINYKADIQTKYSANPSWLAYVKELPEPYQTDSGLHCWVNRLGVLKQTSLTTCSETCKEKTQPYPTSRSPQKGVTSMEYSLRLQTVVI